MRVNSLIALLPALASAVPTPGAGDFVPPPKDVTIKSYTYAGSGCPDKSATCVIDADKTAMTCMFDHFSAFTGPGSTVNDARKNCQINVALDIPKGYRFTMADAYHKGTVYLETGLSARMQTKYYFTQNPGAVVCNIRSFCPLRLLLPSYKPTTSADRRSYSALSPTQRAVRSSAMSTSMTALPSSPWSGLPAAQQRI